MPVNLLSAAAKISSFTMLSRITGLLRETLIARTYGASEWTDAFNVAFRIPNLLRRLFAEGAFSLTYKFNLTARMLEVKFIVIISSKDWREKNYN